MEQQIPIIFIHYGTADYMSVTLRMARKTNPDKEIILLGDPSNKELAETYGVKHYLLEDFHFGEELVQFEESFQFLAGSAHLEGTGFHKERGAAYWTKFNLMKWFRLNNFAKEKGYDRLWIWDTDVLMLEALAPYEEILKGCDNTEIAIGSVNGLINNLKFLDEYTAKMNEIFSREDYLDEIRKKLSTKPDYILTMMHMYRILKEEESSSNHKFICEDLGGYMFDNALALPKDFQSKKLSHANMTIKRLWLKEGSFYCKENDKEELIRIVCLNMSWIPTYAYWAVEKALYSSNPLIEFDIESEVPWYKRLIKKIRKSLK